MNTKIETKNNTKKSGEGFTAEEKAAMKARTLELKLEARANKDRAIGESAVLTAISQMKEDDRSMAQKLHEIITTNAPALMPKTWYGMPAYANTDGKVICFFQAAGKFNVRYATFGFQPDANLDEGNMWATSFALLKLTAFEEAKIIALVKKGVR
ncbi:MAG: iron chaperone [Anaerolineaceae bacterium]